jgi:hypothetical protein
MAEQVQMTEEEMRKYAEEHKKEFDAFMSDLVENPTDTLTKKDLARAIEFISEDMGGLAQMTHSLYQDFQGLVHVLRNGQLGTPSVSKSKGGIILP